MSVKTKAEEVVPVVATDEVKVWDPVPEVKARAVLVVLLPMVMVLAELPVPRLIAPVPLESIPRVILESDPVAAMETVEGAPVAVWVEDVLDSGYEWVEVSALRRAAGREADGTHRPAVEA